MATAYRGLKVGPQRQNYIDGLVLVTDRLESLTMAFTCTEDLLMRRTSYLILLLKLPCCNPRSFYIAPA